MIKSKRLLAAGVAAALVLAACGGDDDDASESTEAPAATEAPAEETEEMSEEATEEMSEEATEEMTEEATEEMTEETTESTEAPAGDSPCDPPADPPTVGVTFDITGRGDRSFNDAAGAGLDQAVADFGVVASESTPTGEGDRAERVQGLVDAGNGLVIMVGFLFGDAAVAATENNPNTCFGIIDSVVDAPNMASILFAEEQGSALVGAAAALKSQTGKIGFIGGVENDLIKKFEAGYVWGAQQINPDIEVLINYITQPPNFDGFNDPARGREIATAQYDDGADIIYSAAGGSGLGAFEAAVDAGAPGEVWAIGVDSDQYNLVSEEIQPYILTSMLKLVDVATFNTIESYVNGTFTGGIGQFDLAAGGVGYSTSGGFVDDIAADLDALGDQIISGELMVPDTP